MNLELIAIEIGDYVKYTTSLNEIQRIANALFKFPYREFPNESITSVRAQLIYNWIMSLNDYECTLEEKEKLLINFAKSLDPDLRSHLRTFGVGEGDEPSSDKFDSNQFHHEIKTHCRKLYMEGNYFHAVLEAAKLYNSLVKSKTGSDKDGQSLMMEAWNIDKGLLKINSLETETQRNFQDGIKFLSAGLISGFRNPTAHEPALHWIIDEQDATDILSLVSFLLRQYDKS